MPISQDRMIALVKAGQDYQLALNYICELITTSARAVRAAQLTPEAALKLITEGSQIEAQVKTNSAVVLALEARHFQTHQRLNIRAKERQESKRSGKVKFTSQTRTTAPSTFAPHPQDGLLLDPDDTDRALAAGQFDIAPDEAPTTSAELDSLRSAIAQAEVQVSAEHQQPPARNDRVLDRLLAERAAKPPPPAEAIDDNDTTGE